MVLFNIFFFAFSLCSSLVAQRIPTITNITQKQIKDIGGQVDLACSVHNAQDYRVLWVKYDRQGSKDYFPLSLNSALVVRDLRYTLKFDDKSDFYTSTLTIQNVQESDAGWYQCLVLLSDEKKLENNSITAEVELQVRK